MSPIPELAQEDDARVEAFADRLLGAGLAALELLNVELGMRLSLYERLVEHGSATPVELA
ncbi:MAG: hypothetical protein M3276_07045 [Actinomycetota bacterium]|nr:hypothetical protein [Actinomycetota bacterium]